MTWRSVKKPPQIKDGETCSQFVLAAVASYSGVLPDDARFHWDIIIGWRERGRDGIERWFGDNQGQDGGYDEINPQFWMPMPMPERDPETFFRRRKC